MLTDSILRLKVAFANIPLKGVFFWEALLSLQDDEYNKVVTEGFANTMNSFPAEEKEATAYYKEILSDLQEVKQGISENPEIRSEVEKIREELISEAAHEVLIEKMRDSLPEGPKNI